MRSCRATWLAAVLVVTCAASTQAQTVQPELAACAWVRVENDGAGAGFVVDAPRKLLITCRHLVAERTKVDVIFPWLRDGELVTDRQAYLANRLQLRERGLLVTGKVLKTSDEPDLALVELESLPLGIRSVSFATREPALGEQLRVIGNRLDLDTVWNLTTGPVRTSGQLADGYFWRGKKLSVNSPVMIGQLPTEEGDSGGPVFNDRGELVGMASALRRQCPLAAIVISGSEIRRFAGVPEPAHHVNGELPRSADVVDALMRGTVWVRPTATDRYLAGVLIEKDLVLTCATGLNRGDRVGVAFPVREGNRWVGERAPYKDPVGLALKRCWQSGVVLARDPGRELALIRLDSVPELSRAIPLATRTVTPGERIHAMNHPGGLEFAWVYASGTVRQRGGVTIARGEHAPHIASIVCQLPAQAGSPGGPVLNDRCELVGLLSDKESGQQVGYAVEANEIHAFLDVALFDRTPYTLAGLLSRIDELPARFLTAAARGMACQAEEHRREGRLAEARDDCDRALSLDPECLPARLCRAKMLDTAPALAELDGAVETGSFDRAALFLRAQLAAQFKDWRKARSDLERILDANPLDAEVRQQLIGVLLELNEDAKALAAVGDTLRADPKRLSALAADLLAQADELAKKFPDAPGIPAGWLMKAVAAAETGTRTSAAKSHLADLLKRAASLGDDRERLGFLRAGLKKLSELP